MILNPKASSFYFNFPKGFFSDRVIQKYTKYIERQPIPFDNVQSYVNSTIQSISFPSLNIDTVEQVRPLGKKINYKSATPIQDLFSKDISINFKAADGYINYFIMLDTVLDYLNFANPEPFIPVLPLRVLDGEGNVVFSVQFDQVIFSSFTGLELSYTANNPTYTSFTLGFTCNYLDIKFEAK